MNATVFGPAPVTFSRTSRKDAAQRVLIEITRADKIEARRLERLCDQARIVGRRRKRSDLIAGIADNKRKAFFGAGGAGLRQLPPLRRRHRALGRTIRNRRSPA